MPDLEDVLTGLNEAQREAALALRGPVAILAGAGTGKTTTITSRIACQVRGGAFEPSQILAVTFTDKAAGELRARLGALGVEGVEARTFHSAALSQLSRLWTTHTGEKLPEILDHKAPLIASLANALPPPHRFLPRRELAGEIEWAKNRMITPARYLGELGDHEPPIPPELMHRVYDGYERRKRSMGRLDFEDMLGLALRLFDEHPDAAEQVRSRFAAFTVDEYQDVNPLQAGLLERWLGDRDDLCVVGDDYQTIYAFTGASPEHLPRLHAAVPARDGRPPGGEPPLHAPGARAREPARGPAGRVPQDAPGDPPLRPTDARARRTRRGGRGGRGGPGRAAPPHRGGGPARGDRGAVPDQRALRAVRGGVRRRGDPVPGARRRVPPASRSPRGPAAAEAFERPRGDRGRSRRGDHRPARLRPRGRSRRRRGGHAPVRPRPDAVARGGVRARRRAAMRRRSARSSRAGSRPSTPAAA